MKLLKELIKIVSPSGFEGNVQALIIRELKEYGKPHRIDDVGNIWVEDAGSRTLFTAHMDCVHNNHPVLFDVEEGVMSLSLKSKQTALGADDKTGVRMLLHLLKHNTPGTYLFTVEEEVGCVGAAHAAKSCPSHINQAICFDRKANDSIITRMSGRDCCSSEFAESLIKELGKGGLVFKKDRTGSTTDTNKFSDATLNHTNISAGYQDEHTIYETLDLKFFKELMKASLLVDWEGLSEVERPKYVVPVYSPPAYKKWEEEEKEEILDLVCYSFSHEDALENVVEFVKKKNYLRKSSMVFLLETLQEYYGGGEDVKMSSV